VGTLPKHARFGLEKVARHGDTKYAVSRGGFAVKRNGVRIARRIKRPKEIKPRDKWVHLDLDEQTFVAYEGNEPVFASLISSGKKGYRTRAGLYRIVKKYLTTTMDATDPIDGFYRIEEVPWTMYYWRSFAVHGAFWHDDFGQVRSHGCTNIAPADARWLFRWTTPKVPDGWHARFSRGGTWFYFTD
jgi:lipoprotein-anchoring transpeptidase ErfK/SrfK